MLHYVWMVEKSITYGRHFYSVWGVVHSFLLGHRVVNALHNTMKTLLRQIMAMWYSHFVCNTPGMSVGGCDTGILTDVNFSDEWLPP